MNQTRDEDDGESDMGIAPWLLPGGSMPQL
jgi:hypothetical protein